MADVIVPKTPRKAFNPGRKPSSLITAQVEHLEAALGLFKGAGQRRVRPQTEGEAAEYIAQLTAQLHPQPGAMPVESPVPPGVTAITRARAKSIPRRLKKPRAKLAAKPSSPSTARTRKRATAKSTKAAKSAKGAPTNKRKTSRPKKKATSKARKTTRRRRGERG